MPAFTPFRRRLLGVRMGFKGCVRLLRAHWEVGGGGIKRVLGLHGWGFHLGLMLSSVFADSLGNLVTSTRGPFALSVARSD